MDENKVGELVFFSLFVGKVYRVFLFLILFLFCVGRLMIFRIAVKGYRLGRFFFRIRNVVFGSLWFSTSRLVFCVGVFFLFFSVVCV